MSWFTEACDGHPNASSLYQAALVYLAYNGQREMLLCMRARRTTSDDHQKKWQDKSVRYHMCEKTIQENRKHITMNGMDIRIKMNR